MRQAMTLAALAAATASTAAPASAQGGDGAWEVRAETVLVGSAIDADDPLAPEADALMASMMLGFSRSDTLENGVTIGLQAGVRYDRDAPSRPAFAGAFGGCLPSNPACPSVGPLAGSGVVSPVSPSTGLSAGGAPFDETGIVAIEALALTVGGPWGEGEIGYDAGAAVRLDARAPSVLGRVSAVSPGLDPTGLVLTRARNDVTGVSPKITYLSPRWLGVRAGASYTPEADTRSADFDPRPKGSGLAGADLENVWEGAISFARQFAEQDLRVRAAITYTNADSGAGLPEFGGYEAWGAGLELEHDGWTGGARWLSSNNAWTNGNGDYEAWELGLVKEVDGWRIGVEAGHSKDDLSNLEGSSWLLGINRVISHNLEIGVAWTSADADIPIPAGLSVGHRNASNDGLVVELSVRN